jgi:hypothetical protein
MGQSATTDQHAENVESLDRMMLELDAMWHTLDHEGGKQFCWDALCNVRNLRAVESVLRWGGNPDA